MRIRLEQAADQIALRALLKAAFGHSLEAKLVAALHASGCVALSLVAELDGVLVAQALFSELQAPEGCLALAPLSVLPALQNRGFGTALVKRGIAEATAKAWQAIFVLGEPAYYGRFGFCTELAWRFESSYPKSHFMALELRAGALDGRAGPVIFAPPFAAL